VRREGEGGGAPLALGLEGRRGAVRREEGRRSVS